MNVIVSTPSDAQEQYTLAIRLFDGEGVDRDDGKAFELVMMSAEQGNRNGLRALGWAYWQGRGTEKNLEKAIANYRLAADQGDAGAQYRMGAFYKDGVGVPQSWEETAKWHRLAADQGNSSAQLNLGWMYEMGKGVAASYIDALKYYRLAADQGNSTAQTNIGILYEYGRGVVKSEDEALRWYRIAAQQGNVDAKKNEKNLTRNVGIFKSPGIKFHTRTAKILSVESKSEVYSRITFSVQTINVGGNTSTVRTPQTSLHTDHWQEAWIEYKSGEQERTSLPDGFAVRPGHKITFIYARPQKQDSGHAIRLINHDTNKTWDYEYKAAEHGSILSSRMLERHLDAITKYSFDSSLEDELSDELWEFFQVEKVRVKKVKRNWIVAIGVIVTIIFLISQK